MRTRYDIFTTPFNLGTGSRFCRLQTKCRVMFLFRQLKELSKGFFLIILFINIYSSCTERVEIGLKDAGNAKLVVFAEITNDIRAHEVHLTTTAPYFHNQKMPTVSNALVYIDDGTENIELIEDPDRAGVYLTPDNYFGVTGRTYKLQISNVDADGDGNVEEYEAETIMKSSAPVDSIHVTYNTRWEGWEVALYSYDQQDREDWYLFKVYKNGVLYTDTIYDYWTTNDKFFNGNKIDGPMVQYFDEDEGEIVETGDTITLELAGITEEYYYFIEGVFREVGEKNPLFSGPAANVKGNISNDALGFFSVMEVSRGSTIYNGE